MRWKVDDVTGRRRSTSRNAKVVIAMPAWAQRSTIRSCGVALSLRWLESVLARKLQPRTLISRCPKSSRGELCPTPVNDYSTESTSTPVTIAAAAGPPVAVPAPASVSPGEQAGRTLMSLSSSLPPSATPPSDLSSSGHATSHPRPRIPNTPPPSPPPSPRHRLSSSQPRGRHSAGSSPSPPLARPDAAPLARLRHSASTSYPDPKSFNDLPPLPSPSSVINDQSPAATAPAPPVFPSRPHSLQPTSKPRPFPSTPVRHSVAAPTTGVTTRAPFPSPPPRSLTTSQSDPNLRPRTAFEPRSAVPNYFNVDFSFLYEEEPPRRSRQSFGGGGTLKKKASGTPRNSLGEPPGISVPSCLGEGIADREESRSPDSVPPQRHLPERATTSSFTRTLRRPPTTLPSLPHLIRHLPPPRRPSRTAHRRTPPARLRRLDGELGQQPELRPGQPRAGLWVLQRAK